MMPLESPRELETNVLSSLRTYCATHPEIRMAWLFGSFASGRAMQESDVDIALWLDGEYSFTDIARCQGDLELIVSRPVDVVIMNDANPLVALEAVNGMLLYESSEPERLEHCLQIWRAAEDWAYFMRSFLQERRWARGEITR